MPKSLDELKFLIISSEFPPQPGGIGNHAWGLFQSLQEKGAEVQVLTNSREQKQEKEWLETNKLSGGQIIFVPRKSMVVSTYLQRMIEGWRLIRPLSSPTDVVVFSGKFSVWLLAILPMAKDVKKWVVIHGSEIRQDSLGAFLFKRALKRSNSVVSVSHYTQERLLNSYRVAPQRLKVINNGFTMESTQDLIPTKQNKESTSLITVGSLTERKGQLNVIRALPRLLSEYKDLKYLMLGLPTEEARIREQAENLGVSGHIQITGAVIESEKWEYLGQSFIFMMLSEDLPNGDFEGFGIAILEANHMGLPAIGSINSGIADAIDHGYSGFLVDPHNPEEIAEAIRTIMSNYESYSENARKHAAKFHWDRKVEEYLALLDR